MHGCLKELMKLTTLSSVGVSKRISTLIVHACAIALGNGEAMSSITYPPLNMVTKQ